MAVIAVAGGTGSGLGRNVVQECAANPKHKVIILSRSTSKIPQWVSEYEVEVRKVDYSSEQSLIDGLNGVDTVQ
jgi:uncharacterized protein YbjT (DUF2867 family)